MAWNNSGNDKNRDPWGGRGDHQGPPDLDALLRKLKNKLAAKLGAKTIKPNGGGGGFSVDFHFGPWIAGLTILILIVIWALSGIFIVSPAERAVILSFGKYTDTVGPGPHWIPRFIQSAYIVNVQKVSNYSYQADMLTKDENIVNVTVAVQYRINNAKDYLFNIVNANSSLQQATASALRQVVGHSTLDDILTTGRQTARDQMAQQLQDLLNLYQSGLVATDVTLQSSKPPEPVTAAFDDAIKAREDQQSYINKANAYANKVTATAQGQAARILQEASAYQKEVVLEAQAAVVGYLALLPEYQKAPEVTRERLYLNSVESVLGKVGKILVDTNGNNNILYLPLDKMISESRSKLENSIELEKDPATASAMDASSDALINTSNNILNRPGYPTRGSY